METIITNAMAAGMTREQAETYASVMIANAEAKQIAAGAATTAFVASGLSAAKTTTKVVGLSVTNFLSGMLRGM